MSTHENNPVADIVTIDYIRLATFNFQHYLELEKRIRQKYVGWRKSRWLQYSMQRSQDSVSYGIAEQDRKPHAVFEASGAQAHMFFHWLKRLPVEYTESLYATRIDLQCTKLAHDDLDYIETHKRLRKPKQLILGDDGNTLYIGNRQSDSYWRLYDKSDLHVRLEVELKGKQAKAAFRALLAGKQPSSVFDAKLKKSRVPKYLADYYANGSDALDLADFNDHLDDMQKKLQWLSTLDQLVYKLLNDHDVGERARLLINRWSEYGQNVDKDGIASYTNQT